MLSSCIESAGVIDNSSLPEESTMDMLCWTRETTGVFVLSRSHPHRRKTLNCTHIRGRTSDTYLHFTHHFKKLWSQHAFESFILWKSGSFGEIRFRQNAPKWVLFQIPESNSCFLPSITRISSNHLCQFRIYLINHNGMPLKDPQQVVHFHLFSVLLHKFNSICSLLLSDGFSGCKVPPKLKLVKSMEIKMEKALMSFCTM